MKVTPVGKKFGKHKPGDEFQLPNKAAKVFIKLGKLQEVQAVAPTYETKVLKAEDDVPATPAPRKRAYQRRDLKAAE
jgi:hypothetical protein